MEEEYIDIRNVKRSYDVALARFKADSGVSDHNKELILSFIRDAMLGKTVHRRAKKKIGPARLLGYIVQLYPLLSFLDKDLDQVTQEDMEHFIEALETDRIRSRSPRCRGANVVEAASALSPRYKVDIKITVKKFYKWLWGENRDYPSIVNWIDTFMEPKEISALTESEVEMLVDQASSPIYRAVIQLLFDGGFRIGELLNIRLRHVRMKRFDPNDPSKCCFLVRVPFSKTLRRTVALPMQGTTRRLKLWLKQHPAKPIIAGDGSVQADDTHAQLFPVTENAVRLMFRRVGQVALNKRVYPHLLRHTSATYWSNRLSYFKMCKRFGWTMTSNMPQRYIDREGVDEIEMAQIYQEDEKAKSARQNLQLNDDLSAMNHQLEHA